MIWESDVEVLPLAGLSSTSYFLGVSKSEILAELPRLHPDERREILEQLWEIEEKSLLEGVEPDPVETALLDRELAAFEKDKEVGAPWREAMARIRRTSSR